MNNHALLLAASWADTAIVAGILLAAAAFLTVLTIRFFRGQTTCSCTGNRKGCPVAQAPAALEHLAKTSGRKGGD